MMSWLPRNVWVGGGRWFSLCLFVAICDHDILLRVGWLSLLANSKPEPQNKENSGKLSSQFPRWGFGFSSQWKWKPSCLHDSKDYHGKHQSFSSVYLCFFATMFLYLYSFFIFLDFFPNIVPKPQIPQVSLFFWQTVGISHMLLLGIETDTNACPTSLEAQRLRAWRGGYVCRLESGHPSTT